MHRCVFYGCFVFTLMLVSSWPRPPKSERIQSKFMKHLFSKVRVILAVSAIAVLVAATAYARAGKQDFTLHNDTGVEIHELYVSPVTTDDWEEDILGQDTLADGDSLTITFDDRDKHVHWDLKVVDSKGNSIEWHDLNLIEISEVTLHYEKGKAWADIK